VRAAAPVLAGASLVWLLLILAAPVLASEVPAAAAVPYLAGRVVCHQRADRTFHLRGVQLPVCGRCLGLYAAAPAGAFVALLSAGDRRRTRAADLRRILAIAALPTMATLVIEWSGVGGVSSVARALAAAPLGAAVAWVLVRECSGEPGVLKVD
jgi:uncharacterized membrane protein